MLPQQLQRRQQQQQHADPRRDATPCLRPRPSRQLEGDTAKLSDAFYTIMALNKHVEKLGKVQGSFVNMLLDDAPTPLPTVELANEFGYDTFGRLWKPRFEQAVTDVMVATAILDPRCAATAAAAAAAAAAVAARLTHPKRPPSPGRQVQVQDG